MVFSVASNTVFTDYWKVIVLNFRDGNTVFFELKSWWRDNTYWLLETSWFELFGGVKYSLFLSQKVDGKMIFTDYWNVLVLNFSEMANTVSFWGKKLMKRWYLLLLKSSCFELFRDGKYGLFWAKKVDGKMIFTWSSWAFHDIPGLEKYGFFVQWCFKIFWRIRSLNNSENMGKLINLLK